MPKEPVKHGRRCTGDFPKERCDGTLDRLAGLILAVIPRERVDQVLFFDQDEFLEIVHFLPQELQVGEFRLQVRLGCFVGWGLFLADNSQHGGWALHHVRYPHGSDLAESEGEANTFDGHVVDGFDFEFHQLLLRGAIHVDTSNGPIRNDN